MKKKYLILAFLALLILILAFLLLLIGSVEIPVVDWFYPLSVSDRMILYEIRIPKMVAALIAGISLGVVGLVMQTYFSNPLADPHILGVQSGAALGVACGVMLLDSISDYIPANWFGIGSIMFASVGSFLTLLVLLILSQKLGSKLILLVIGLVFGQIVGGIINILMMISETGRIKNYLLWSMGSFQRINSDQLMLFCSVIIITIVVIFLFSSQLNLLLLGEKYAQSMGMDVLGVKRILLIISAITIATVTSFCGPIAFVGIISGHLARLLLKTSNHYLLLPASGLIGAAMTMSSELISSSLGDATLPINAILGLIGGPVVLFILLGYKKAYES